MTEQQIALALEESAIDVLEKMFFISAVATAEAPTAPIAIQMAFRGDPPGRLDLRLSPSAAAAIAGNFLGEDSSALAPRQVAEVAGELANMICGAVLSRLESTATFQLSPPEVLPVPGPSGSGPTVCLDTGDGLLAVLIETETPICPASAKSAS